MSSIKIATQPLHPCQQVQQIPRWSWVVFHSSIIQQCMCEWQRMSGMLYNKYYIVVMDPTNSHFSACDEQKGNCFFCNRIPVSVIHSLLTSVASVLFQRVYQCKCMLAFEHKFIISIQLHFSACLFYCNMEALTSWIVFLRQWKDNCVLILSQ